VPQAERDHNTTAIAALQKYHDALMALDITDAIESAILAVEAQIEGIRDDAARAANYDPRDAIHDWQDAAWKERV
jgi:hypothetical protein